MFILFTLDKNTIFDESCALDERETVLKSPQFKAGGGDVDRMSSGLPGLV